MKEAYENDKKFKGFVDKFRNKHGLSVEEALRHSVVREVFENMEKEK